MKQIARRLGLALVFVLGAGSAQAQVVVSQVYGGGGNTGATLRSDFIELHNNGTTAVNLSGWSVQYAASTGTTWSRTNLSGTIAAGGYFLVKQADGAGGTVSLPTPDVTGTIPMSGSNGKVALVNDQVTLSGSCPVGGSVVDFVGFGSANCSETSPTPALTNTTAALRGANGCTDTGNNSSDFTTGTPDPRNSASAANTCGVSSPLLSINDVSLDEGNSGLSFMTFTISLSIPAGPGGVSFNALTADGTATANSDYVPHGRDLTIPEGSSSITFQVQIYGDTDNEPNEGFFVNITNVTGATVSKGQGLGSIQNDDVTVVAIHAIQGSGLTSPYNGQIVTTEGIVTALKFNNGFFLQTADAEADADPATSQGIFVFTSTAPPATAAVGNRVRVTATVTEFTPSTDPNQLPITELVSPTVVQLSSGNPLPAATVLTNAEANASATPGTLERYEGMRVSVPEATVVEGSDGNITESSANATTTGVFQVVLAGVARPYREPGIGVMDVFPIPAGKNPPFFDTNQERLMVRSRGQVGATAVALDAGATVTGMVGVLDYFGGTWALLPDAGTVGVSGGKAPVALANQAATDITIGGFNLLRFFDEINNSNGAPTLTAAALDKRLTKTSLAICDYVKTPDILGVVEVENLRVLGLLADRINSTCASAPAYVPYLVQGNDLGGINVGFLVSTRDAGGASPAARVEVVEVTQYGKDALFNNPDGSSTVLNDRPPLLLRANVHGANGATVPVTVIVNHLRSLNGIDDTTAGSSGWPTEGDRVRNKRAQQAKFLADIVQGIQQSAPAEKVVLVGDFTAFEFNDGYADIMGIVRGDEVPADQAVTWLASPITTPLVDGSDLIADPAERYSYVFEGSAQTLDHVVVSESLLMDPLVASAKVEHARINADFGVHNYGVAGNAIRVSDHDPVRLTIGLVNDTTPPSVTHAISGPTGLAGWFIGDVVVDWTVADAESPVTASTGCGDTVLSSDTIGASFTCTATSWGGTTSQTTATVRRDATAPVIVAAATTAPNANGWYRGDVLVAYTCSDATSGLATACPSGQRLTTEGDAVQSTARSVRDNAGNTTLSNVVTVKIDKTVPTITATPTTSPNANGWYTSDVTVAYTCTDAGSGIASCPADQIVRMRGATALATGRNTIDRAGLTSATVSVPLKIDSSAPLMNPTISNTLSSGVLALNAVASASANASDPESGISTATCGAIDTSTIGSRTVTCTATNAAGLTTTKTLSYKVVYLVSFAAPLVEGGYYASDINKILRVQWRVADAAGNGIDGVVGTASFVGLASCPAGTPVALTNYETTSNNTVQSLGNGEYWRTLTSQPSYAGTCKKIRVNLSDGVVHDLVVRYP